MNFEATKENIIFALSLFFAVWFAFTSSFWEGLSNIFISYPFGLISLALLIVGTMIDPEKWRYNIVQCVLLFGVLFSMFMLMFL